MGVERLNIALTPDAINAVAKLQGRTGRKKVDIVNTALQLLEWLDAAARRGDTILLENPNEADQPPTVVKIFY